MKIVQLQWPKGTRPLQGDSALLLWVVVRLQLTASTARYTLAGQARQYSSFMVTQLPAVTRLIR